MITHFQDELICVETGVDIRAEANVAETHSLRDLSKIFLIVLKLG